MFDQPELERLLDAIKELWHSECNIDRTPQRRRISDDAAILFRSAFCHATVHDTVVDHVMAFTKGRVAADAAGERYPLNHVANVMPLSQSINSKRLDRSWDTFFATLTAVEKTEVSATLLLDATACGESALATGAAFRTFLQRRYQAMVDRALTNVQHAAWLELPDRRKQTLLNAVTD